MHLQAWYCSICESLLINGIGVYCDCCGVCADPECIKKANATLQCKIVTSNKEIQLHHWVKGMKFLEKSPWRIYILRQFTFGGCLLFMQ